MTSDKKKVRKGQSLEEFERQRALFAATGPTLNTQEGLYDEQHLQSLDNSRKPDRVLMLHACERAYYQRDYPKSLELIERAEKLFGVAEREVDPDLVKKSAKIERHIVDLLHIKQRCLERINTSEASL